MALKVWNFDDTEFVYQTLANTPVGKVISLSLMLAVGMLCHMLTEMVSSLNPCPPFGYPKY